MMDDYGLRFNAPKNFKNGRPAVVTMFIPGALCYVITLPTGGVYHNNMVLLQVLIRFAKARKNYLWEGIYKEDNEKE